MKKSVILLLFLVLLFVSCNKDEASVKFLLEDKFEINQVFQSEINDLKFSITEINDSRCPSNANCNWQGAAEVKIQVTSPFKGTVTLNTFNNRTDTLNSYSFELIEVTPYPISTETIELKDYKVNLKIEEL
jgi:hypothetical protein